MTSSPGVIYEVSQAIEQDTIVEFDDWLRSHVDEMLTLPGSQKLKSSILRMMNAVGPGGSRIIISRARLISNDTCKNPRC